MKGNRSITIETAQTFFVTTNKGLAYASKNFDKTLGKKEGISPCITDIFLGTILWFQDPIRYDKLKESQIIASCYAAIKPNSVMVNKFVKEVDKLKEDNQITSDDYILLKNYEVLNSMLSDKTMGNIDNINEDMTYEMLNDIKAEIKRDLNKKLEEEKRRADEIEENKNEIERKNNETVELIKKEAKNKAKFKKISFIIISIIIPIVIIILDLYFNIMDFLKVNNVIVVIIRIFVYGVIAYFSIKEIIKQFKDLPQIEEKEYNKLCHKYKIQN